MHNKIKEVKQIRILKSHYVIVINYDAFPFRIDKEFSQNEFFFSFKNALHKIKLRYFSIMILIKVFIDC